MLGVRLLILAGLLGCTEAGGSLRVVNPAPAVVTQGARIDANRAAQPLAIVNAWQDCWSRLVIVAAMLAQEEVAEHFALAERAARDSQDGSGFAALLTAGGATRLLSALFDLQADVEPKPDTFEPEPDETGRRNPELSDQTGCSYPATSRNGPNSAMLLALLALAAARARHRAARRSASA